MDARNTATVYYNVIKYLATYDFVPDSAWPLFTDECKS